MLGANVPSVHLHLMTVRAACARLLQAACAIVLLVLIAGLCAALLPRPFGYRPAVVTSGSMGRSIPIGSLAMTHTVGVGAIHVGDVILIHEEADGVAARPKLHRVVSVEQDSGNTLVSTKGDANAAPDPKLYVLPARVDVVAYSMPYLGYLVGFMLTPIGWVLAVGLPGAIVCGYLLRRIWASEGASQSAERAGENLVALAGSTPTHERGRDKGQGPGIERLPGRFAPRIARPSLLTISVALVAIAASTVAATAYVTVPRPATSSDGGRLAREATSLTQHSARLATGESYAADLLVLRDAEDPAVRAADRPLRDAALSRLLTDASNVFDALAVIDPAGHIIASTDPSIVDVHASAAFLLARANGGVASSAGGSAAGSPGRVDYAAPLRTPNGSLAGVLLARSSAARLWAPTLETTVDGSRNVIVDAAGKLIAGAAPEALGSAWNLAPGRFGGLHGSVGGVPSVCGASAIGEGTHLDIGWRVASCLPDSFAAGNSDSLRRYGASLAVSALAVVLVAAIVLYVLARRERVHPGRSGAPVEIDVIEARLRARGA